MVQYTFSVFSFADLDNLPIGGNQTVVVSGPPDIFTIDDDDSKLHEYNDDPDDPGFNQKVVGTATIDGVAQNPNLTDIAGEADYVVTNNTTGETGKLVLVSLLDSNQNSREFIGFTSTIPLNPGDSITVGPIDAENEGIEYSSLVVCFARGTQIATLSGRRAVEELKVGDMVLTMDRGEQPIRWIGSMPLDLIDLHVNPKLKPIRIRAGVLGHGIPQSDLWVSRQHRMLVASEIAQEMFGCDEVLIPAIKLIEIDGIEIAEETKSVEYFHILFDHHEVILANGAPAESLLVGAEALKALGPDAKTEIETLFPEILSRDFEPRTARHIPKQGEQMKKLARRHKRNNPILSMNPKVNPVAAGKLFPAMSCHIVPI